MKTTLLLSCRGMPQATGGNIVADFDRTPDVQATEMNGRAIRHRHDGINRRNHRLAYMPPWNKIKFHSHHGTEQPAKQPHLHEFAVRTPYLPAQSLGDRASPKGTKEKCPPYTISEQAKIDSNQCQTRDLRALKQHRAKFKVIQASSRGTMVAAMRRA